MNGIAARSSGLNSLYGVIKVESAPKEGVTEREPCGSPAYGDTSNMRLSAKRASAAWVSGTRMRFTT